MRVGIVGVGFGARVHLPAFLSLDGVETVGIADGGSGRAERLATGFGRRVRAYGRWHELADDPQIDVVTVATPPRRHLEVVRRALQAGKHVLCEKPFGRTLEEARMMSQRSTRPPRIGAVGFEFRMDPALRALKKRIEAGEVGPVRSVEVRWLTGGRADPRVAWSWQNDALEGGGVLSGFGSHAIDYTQWICSSPVLHVSAEGRILVPFRADPAGVPRPVTAEDFCRMEGKLGNGTRFVLEMSNCDASSPGHLVRVAGDRGILTYLHRPPFADGHQTLECSTSGGRPRRIFAGPLASDPEADSRIPMFRELARRFLAAARGMPDPDLPDFACGTQVQSVLEAARTSMASRKMEPVVAA